MNSVEKHFRQVNEGMTLLDGGEIEKVILALKMVRSQKGVVYIVGNGGSAATASHFANDLMKIAKVRAVCLNDMVPVVTAYGNDDGWGRMYANPLRKMLNGNDAVFGISCSGKSENVIEALRVGNDMGVITLGLTGMENNTAINVVAQIGLVHARVPDIRVQEDLHMMVCHAMVRAIQEEGNG